MFGFSDYREKNPFTKTGLVFIALYILFLLHYLRSFTVQSTLLPGTSLISDFYFSFFVWKKQLSLMQNGFVPFGTFWVDNHIGGIPASLIPFNGWQDLPNFIATAIFALSGDFLITLKIMIYGIFVISAITSYALGYKMTHDQGSSIICSIGYTFSIQHFADIHYGHMNLLAGFAVIPLTILVWDRLLEKPNPRNAILGSFSLVLLFLIEWQCLFFAALFILLRLTWYIKKNMAKSRDIVFHSAFSGALFLLLAAPFLVPTLYYYGTTWNAESLAELPIQSYFVRPFVMRLGWDVPFSYVGIASLALLLIPMLITGNNHEAIQKVRSQYRFFLAAALFFMFYSAANYAPINVAFIIYQIIPFASFIRVVGRSSILVYLCMSILSAMGYRILSNHLDARDACPPRKYRITRRSLKGALLVLICLAIFVDTTFGFEPVATEIYRPSFSGYDFVKEQSGEFRVMEIPQFYGLATITTNYLEHETLDFRPLYLKETEGFIDAYDHIMTLDDNLYVNNGHFEQDLERSWNITCLNNSSIQVQRSTQQVSDGDASLMMSFGPSENVQVVKLEQTLDARPEVTPGLYLSMDVMIEKTDGSKIDVVVALENELAHNVYLHYRFDKRTSIPQVPIVLVPTSSFEWNTLRRNLTTDLGPSDINQKWYAKRIEIIVENGITEQGQSNKVFLDSIAVYRMVDAYTKLTMYGVKYLILHVNPDFLRKWIMSDPWSAFLTRSKILNIISYLDVGEDFRKVYNDDDIYVYENVHFKGLIFLTRPISTHNTTGIDVVTPVRASVSYSRKDPNTLLVSVYAYEPCLLVISQNFFSKWKATDMSQQVTLFSVSGTCGVSLDAGAHNLKLHFQSYEESLLLFPFFYLPVFYVFILLATRRRLDPKGLKTLVCSPLSIYGSCLVAFSTWTWLSPWSFSVSWPEFDPFGRTLMILGISLNVGAATILLIAEQLNMKNIATKLILLISASLCVSMAYYVHSQSPSITFVRLSVLLASFSISALILLEKTDQTHRLSLAAELAKKSAILRSQASQVLRGRRAMTFLLLSSLLCVVLFSILRKAAPIWENNVFKGYVLYASPLSRLSILINAMIMICLTGLFWADKRREFLSSYTLVPIATATCAMLSLNLIDDNYIISSNPLTSIVLLMPLVSFLTASLLFCHIKYGPMVIKRGLTVETVLLRAPLRMLAFLFIGLCMMGSVWQEGYIHEFLSWGAFGTFLLVVLIYGMRISIEKDVSHLD